MYLKKKRTPWVKNEHLTIHFLWKTRWFIFFFCFITFISERKSTQYLFYMKIQWRVCWVHCFTNLFYEWESTQFLNIYCLWRTGWPILAFFIILWLRVHPVAQGKTPIYIMLWRTGWLILVCFIIWYEGEHPPATREKRNIFLRRTGWLNKTYLFYMKIQWRVCWVHCFTNLFYEWESTQFLNIYCLWRTGWPILAFFIILWLRVHPVAQGKTPIYIMLWRTGWLILVCFIIWYEGEHPPATREKRNIFFTKDWMAQLNFDMKILWRIAWVHFLQIYFMKERAPNSYIYILFMKDWMVHFSFFYCLKIERAPEQTPIYIMFIRTRWLNLWFKHNLIRGSAPNIYENKTRDIFYEGLDGSIKLICFFYENFMKDCMVHFFFKF